LKVTKPRFGGQGAAPPSQTAFLAAVPGNKQVKMLVEPRRTEPINNNVKPTHNEHDVGEERRWKIGGYRAREGQPA
jgi:hypothetical protein